MLASRCSFKFFPAKLNKKGKLVKRAQLKFERDIDWVALEAKITQLGGNSFEFKAEGTGTNLAGLANPVTVKLIIREWTGRGFRQPASGAHPPPGDLRRVGDHDEVRLDHIVRR